MRPLRSSPPSSALSPPVDPFDYVIFGGTGDLALRKIYPSLYFRDWDRQLPDRGRIIAVARGELNQQAFQNQLEAALKKQLAPDFFDSERVAAFIRRFHYLRLDALDPSSFAPLKARLDERPDVVLCFYLAVAPALIVRLTENLVKSGVTRKCARLVIEKPIGHDLTSSRRINEEVGRYFDESHVYRIDHYLGKESVQNLLSLRFSNVLFEHVWSSAAVDHIQITVGETVGLEGRGAYYDEAGAVRDMVQNHLLQLLCLVAMEPPSEMLADAVRDEKQKVLRALRPYDALPQNSDRGGDLVFGQYDEGTINGKIVPSYVEELGKGSGTETFVAMRVWIDNWRWAGVPFYLRTGKRLRKQRSEILVQFRDIPHSAFPASAGNITPNRLLIRLQPDEGVSLSLMTKEPGPGGLRLRNAALDLSFAEAFQIRYPEAYERLLLDVVRGNSTLFMRRDEVEEAWRWLDPIIRSFQSRKKPPLLYSAGSWGPTQSVILLHNDNRCWHEDMEAIE